MWLPSSNSTISGKELNMKRGLISGGVVALCATLVFALASALNSQAADQRLDQMSHGQHAFKASELIGLSVKTSGDEEKGKIKDLMISPTGKVEYAAVSFGGFMGIGDKLFAVPLDAIHLEWKDNKLNQAHVDVTEQTIKQHQGFDDNHWPEQGDRGFMASQPGQVNR
jgi:hypothetical protein